MKLNKTLLNIMSIYQFKTLKDVLLELRHKGYEIDNTLSLIEIPKIKELQDKIKVSFIGILLIDKISITNINALTSKVCMPIQDSETKEIITCCKIVSSKSANGFKWVLQEEAKKNKFIQIEGKTNIYINQYTKQKIVTVNISNFKSIPYSNKNNQKNKKPNFIFLKPPYILKKNTKPHQLKQLIELSIKELDEGNIPDLMPKELEKQLNLQPLSKSLKYIHGFYPIEISKIESFLSYTGFEDRVNLEKIYQWLISEKDKIINKNNDASLKIKSNLIWNMIRDILKTIIPFELTLDQKKTIFNVFNNMFNEIGSNTLIFGEVGSGKTMVAFIVSYVLVKLGFQVAFITPAKILSQQHYEEAKELFKDINIELFTTDTKPKKRREIQKKLHDKTPMLLIGTTGVLSFEFTNLKLQIIDEEQKIGVSHKQELSKKYNCHTVFMTATPIPRTLANTMFSNFKVSKIETKPKNQKQRFTKIMFNSIPQEIDFMNKEMDKGRQTLIIVPSIDSETMINGEEILNKYKQLFKNKEIRFIHGRMSEKEIDKDIADYMNNKYPILIATTMVDSGFSNKNIMFVIVEGADRFGLSQIHQIRGRCARGNYNGYCYLVPSKDKLSEKTKERLLYLTKTENGFELSQKDLELRGSGDITGTVQSGEETDILKYAKEVEIIKKYIEEHEL